MTPAVAHPVLAFTAAYGPGIAAWLLGHRAELGDAFARLAGPVTAALTTRTASLDRIGAALVSQQNGQTEVIGLLHRQGDALLDVQAAVDGVRGGQQALAGSLNLMTSLSMVGLGVSVLAHAILSRQLGALTARVERLGADVRQIKAMIQAEHRAELIAGLTKLNNGLAVLGPDPAQAGRFLGAAVDTLTDSSANYAQQLAAEAGSGNHDYLWLLARHLAVSALAEAACHLQLGQPGLAVRALEVALTPLRAHARAVFDRTVGADPARFLIPAMAGHGVTLEAVAELYRQAGHAGAVGPDQQLSAADRFEALRERLYRARDPRFRVGSAVRRLTAEWAEAAAAVEEVNRVQGLSLAVASCQSTGPSYPELVARILCQVDALRPEAGACLAFFPPAPGADPTSA